VVCELDHTCRGSKAEVKNLLDLLPPRPAVISISAADYANLNI
jgi:hypothetical protein